MGKQVSRVRFLILGAGPSGLAFGARLQQLGIESFLIIEQESKPGGLCRSAMVQNIAVDMGGGHFLDANNRPVCDFLFRFLPETEWNLYTRSSTIEFPDGTVIEYPIESHIWQLPIERQVTYLMDIAYASCMSDGSSPGRFEDWIRWKFGERIADDYMLPYNRKLWSCDLNILGTYWLEKLPSVSFEETLRSVIERKLCGQIPAHRSFHYPKQGGYGSVWESMANALHNHIICDMPVSAIDGRTVNGIYEGEYIISTIPWDIWPNIALLPEDMRKCCQRLRKAAIDIDYYEERYPSDAQWVYCPSAALRHHRVLIPTNFGADIPCYWLETNSSRNSEQGESVRFCNPYAYPLPTVDKPRQMTTILDWAKEQRIFGLGRWGEWEHLNSDRCVQKAILLADLLARSEVM